MWIEIKKENLPKGKVDNVIMWDTEENKNTNVTMNDWQDILSHPHLTHYMITNNPTDTVNIDIDVGEMWYVKIANEIKVLKITISDISTTTIMIENDTFAGRYKHCDIEFLEKLSK